MKFQKISIQLFLLILVSCGTVGGQVTNPNKPAANPSLEQIRLKSISRFAPKGRVQNQDLIRVEMVDDILRHGKKSIPWLINQLEDETETEERVFSFWYNTSAGDVAIVILFNFFTDKKGKPTIEGFRWDDFLERKNKNQMGEEVLRNYIEKYGRAKIRARWQAMWDQKQDKIIWDAACKCFKLSS